MNEQKKIFADRMYSTKKSFIREILKITANPQVISFAGGLPNPNFFPIKEIDAASAKVLQEDGATALQYSTTEGYVLLREWIAKRYLQKKNLKVNPENILITNGSQQALDLLGKVFLNAGDEVLIESPGYLGAIQALSLYEPSFVPVPLKEDGVNIEALREAFKNHSPKLFYGVPNFQNPSGTSYSEENRRLVAEELKKNSNTFFIEDNPYGELRFLGERKTSMAELAPEQTILLGSFSKIVVPSFRIGWIVAPDTIMEKLIVAKQASDLHTNYYSQRVLFEYLSANDVDEHIDKIKAAYRKQRETMVKMLEEYFPKEVEFNKPEGGMFLWVRLPEGISSTDLFNIAAKKNVAFVPGTPFYVDDSGSNTLRLNYSNVSSERIEEGMLRLADAVKELLAKKAVGTKK